VLQWIAEDRVRVEPAGGPGRRSRVTVRA
jgi:hypothetical protein